MSTDSPPEDLGRRDETLERVSDGVVALDEDLRYTYLNERATDILDIAEDELVGTHIWDAFPEAKGTATEAAIDSATEKGKSVSIERYNEAREKWFEVRVYPDESGVSIFFTDITERKSSERDLERTNRQLEALMEHTAEAVYIKDLDGEYQRMNEAAADLFGLDPEDAIGKRDEDLFDEESAEAIRSVDERIVESGERVTEETVRYIDGERHVFVDNKFPYRDVDGQIVGIMGISRDVTGEKERTREFERAEALFENTQDALFVIDVQEGEFVLERVNPAYEEVTGLSNEEMRGESIVGVFGEEDGEAIEAKYRECVERREPLEYEEELSVPEPGSYWETRIAPVIVEDEVVQIVGATRNVTQRKERERRLRRLHAATRTLIEAETSEDAAEIAVEATDDVLGLPMNGVHLYDEDVDGLVPVAISDSSRGLLDDVPVLDSGVAWEAFQNGEPRVHEDVREADDVYDPETPIRSEMCLPLGDHGVLMVSSTEIDAFEESSVTMAKILANNAEATMDQIERERELRETTDTLEAIIRASPDAIAMVDEEGEVTLWNRAAEEIFGWSEDEVLGESAPFVPEEKREEFEQFLTRLDQDETLRAVETVRRTKDGTRLDVSLSSTRVESDGDLVGYLGTFQDITQRVAYERRLERQRDNLELLTQMMSHDIRNDLQMVLAYADMLEGELDGQRAAYVERVLESAQTAVDLTKTARDLAEAMLETEDANEPVLLRRVLYPQIEEVRATYETAALTVDGQVPRVEVLADDMLSSVFRNLLKNAIQHNDSEVPEVSVAVETTPESVAIRVADNGPGIPDDRKDAIFGRGSKGLDSQGTGIGLYLVRTLVERYGGEVSVEDNDPKGAVFVVELDRV